MLSLATFEYDNRLVHSRFTLEKQLSPLQSAPLLTPLNARRRLHNIWREVGTNDSRVAGLDG